MGGGFSSSGAGTELTSDVLDLFSNVPESEYNTICQKADRNNSPILQAMVVGTTNQTRTFATTSQPAATNHHQHQLIIIGVTRTDRRIAFFLVII